MADRKLTHKAFVVLDTIVWRCRQPSQDRASVSYTKLCRLSGVSRPTAVGAVKQLVALRLLAKEKRGVLVVWGKGWAWRQIANVYTLICELSPLPVNREMLLKEEARQADEIKTQARQVVVRRIEAWSNAVEVNEARRVLANLRERRALALALAARR